LPELNQIIFLSTAIFATGLAAIFQAADAVKLRHGAIIIFSACILNFTAFSNYNSLSIEGQAIGFFVLLIIGLHIFVQTKLLPEND
jgi:NADH:ubiquinone oxidoreductase subunit K